MCYAIFVKQIFDLSECRSLGGVRAIRHILYNKTIDYISKKDMCEKRHKLVLGRYIYGALWLCTLAVFSNTFSENECADGVDGREWIYIVCLGDDGCWRRMNGGLELEYNELLFLFMGHDKLFVVCRQMAKKLSASIILGFFIFSSRSIVVGGLYDFG